MTKNLPPQFPLQSAEPIQPIIAQYNVPTIPFAQANIFVNWAFAFVMSFLFLTIFLFNWHPPCFLILGGAIFTGWFGPRYISSRRWSTLTIGENQLFLKDFHHHQLAIPCNEITLITGEKSFSLRVSELFTWQKLSLINHRQQRFTFRFSPQDNAAAYQCLLNVCPQALGISAEGSVAIGGPPDPAKLNDWVEATAESVRKEFWRQGAKTLLSAVLLAGFGVTMLLLFFHELVKNPQNPLLLKVGIFACVACVVSLLLFGSCFKIFARGRSLGQRINDTRYGQPLDIRFLENSHGTSKQNRNCSQD